jgi:hypothetical protein
MDNQNTFMTTEDMYSSIGGGQKVTPPKAPKANSTFLGGQSNDDSPIGTLLGGQSSSGVYFFGGETASELKNAGKVNIVGGIEEKKSIQDKCFYKNVVIPKKNV